VREQFPTLKITEVGKKLGEMWKQIDAEEKKKFEGMAHKDTERYNKQMEGYTPPSDSGESSDEGRKRRRKKAKKDPNRPKRSMSSFMFFANDRRADVKALHPGLKITEIGVKLAEVWRTLTPIEKKKYEDLANKDKERYRTAMESYKPPSTKVESESSDSSDDSSDSDS